MAEPAAKRGQHWQAPVPTAGNPGAYASEKTTFSSEYADRFDPGVVPDTRVVFPPKRPSVASASPAETILRSKGIYSHDPILDGNAVELWRFLATNLNRPHMAVRIVGTHTETRRHSSTDSRGHTSTTTTTVTVTDFSTEVDVSQYVNPQWQRIFTRPSRRASKDAVTPTVRETLEEYTASKNSFKEFRLVKFVPWDFDEVTKLLTQLVQSTGYAATITITFPMQDYKVVALASNDLSRAAHSKVVRVLCVVSCLWLVFWPAWAISRKRMKNRLVCEYAMEASGEVFYARNFGRISNVVMQRLKEKFLIAL